MARLRPILANTTIVVFLLCICVDGCPNQGVFHDRAVSWFDPIVDMLGIWQGSWSVFAPEVDSENFHLELQIEYDDGSVRSWRSPDWQKLSVGEKFIRFREAEYCESLRADRNSRARPELVRYWAERLKPTPTSRPVWAQLTSHSVRLSPPTDEEYQPRGEYPEHSFVEVLYEESWE